MAISPEVKKMLELIIKTNFSTNDLQIQKINGELPQQLKNLITWNKKRTGAMFAGTITHWTKKDINNLSKINNKLSEDKFRIVNWSSGNGYYFGKLESATTVFFDNLFKQAAVMVGKGCNWNEGDVLRRNNLFHAHLVCCKELDDVYLLFHSLEYPVDLEEQKNIDARYVENLNGYQIKDFRTTAKVYKGRNIIWSARTNTLYQPIYNDVAKHFCSPALAAGPFDGSTWEDVGYPNPLRLEQDKLGDEIANLNYFPAEGASTFLIVNRVYANAINPKWQEG